MARYYEETALIEFVKQYTPTIEGETTLECVERAIRNASTADVVSEKAVVDALYELKHKIHDKAVRPNNAGIDAYVSLKTFDAVLQGLINKYEQKNDGGAKYEKTNT